jgi:hypothetical protein
MEITQFALGALSVVFVLFGTATIIGLLKAHAAEKELKRFRADISALIEDRDRTIGYKFEDLSREIKDRHYQSERSIGDHLKFIEDNCKAYTDSRIDKSIAGKSTKAKATSLNS